MKGKILACRGGTSGVVHHNHDALIWLEKVLQFPSPNGLLQSILNYARLIRNFDSLAMRRVEKQVMSINLHLRSYTWSKDKFELCHLASWMYNVILTYV
jgi:hypothetical protein